MYWVELHIFICKITIVFFIGNSYFFSSFHQVVLGCMDCLKSKKNRFSSFSIFFCFVALYFFIFQQPMTVSYIHYFLIPFNQASFSQYYSNLYFILSFRVDETSIILSTLPHQLSHSTPVVSSSVTEQSSPVLTWVVFDGRLTRQRSGQIAC